MQRNDDQTFLQDTAEPGLDHSHLVALETYWQSLRHADEVPTRTALNPAQIETVLPFAFIIQRVAAGTARFRVAGQRIHDLIKLDPRGMPFSTLFHPDARDDIRDIVECAFSDPAIVGLPLHARASMMRPALGGAMVLLPMRDGAKQTTRILGALITPDHAAHRPRRFEIRAGARTRYEKIGDTRPIATLVPPSHRPTQEGPNSSARPALRLVVNNG